MIVSSIVRNFKATNAVLTKEGCDAETRASLRHIRAESQAAAKLAWGAALTSQINSLKTELAAAQGTITAKEGQINDSIRIWPRPTPPTTSVTAAVATAQQQIKVLD